MMNRCFWAESSPLMQEYHDEEYGRLVTKDDKLFEILSLEINQAGLSWETILKKRKNFQKAFLDFQIEKVANFSEKEIAQLMENPGIIRHKKKIQAVCENARRILEIQKEYGSFYRYLKEVLGKISPHAFLQAKDIPSETPLSKKLSQDLKKRGFQFVGSKVCYSFLQSAGFVNDHVTSCFCYQEIEKNRKKS